MNNLDCIPKYCLGLKADQISQKSPSRYDLCHFDQP